MAKVQTQIRFAVDRRGHPTAWRWSIAAGGRWFRIGLDEAANRIATGEARDVTRRPVTTVEPLSQDEATQNVIDAGGF